MTNLEKLADLFNNRNNPDVIGITTGKVISTTPLRISWGDSVVLENDKLVLANLIKNGLLLGNTVIMIPDSSYKLFYIIDKVGA
ncbi:DUF2577 family protein [Desulfosporosinus nitroreducens]|uniref:DUF2577 family protein n=1 Tax=Desulfosporosinus nitroreducens TaxID=2018668 RepID=UPI00207CD7DE|nr:DUF2577 family protein [Desulfosporosinus nitroreducens]MCO1599820.1 DUF2577 domain-containing protein [Desulfosporosinus nitroreducens]